MTVVVFHFLKRSLLFLTLFLLVVVGLVATILFTNVGLKTVMWGAEKALPQLQVRDVDGAIFPKFTLSDLSFVDPSLTLDIESKEVIVAIDAKCFLEPAVCVDQLQINGLAVSLTEIPPSTSDNADSQSTSSTDVSVPVAISLNNIEFNDIQLAVLGNHIQWQQFSTALQMQGRELTLLPTKLKNIVVELAESSNNDKEKQTLPAKQDKPNKIILPEVMIPLEIDLKAFEVEGFSLAGEAPINVSYLRLSALADGHDVDVRSLQVTMPQADLTAKSRVQLSGDYALNLEANAEIKQTDIQGQKIQLSAEGSVADLLITSSLTGTIGAKINGRLKPLESNFPFDIELIDGKAQWPLKGNADYRVAIARLMASGSLDGYDLKLDTDIHGASIPDVDVSVKGNGDLTQIELDSILLKTLGGHVAGQVMANWTTPVNWKATLSLDNIQPGLQWQEAEGNLSGSLVTSGELLASGGWRVALPNLDIDGVIRGYPLNIQGDLNAQDTFGKGQLKLVTQGLNLLHGPNRVSISGQIDKNWNIDTVIDVPQLNKTLPDMSGIINGELSLRGELDKPKIKTGIDAKQLTFKNEFQLSQVSLTAELSPFPVAEGAVTLNLVEARYQDKKIESVDLRFLGTQLEHDLNLAVVSDIVNANLQIEGALEEKPTLAWKGALNRAHISTEQGPWELDSKIDIEVLIEQQIANIKAHCWSQANSKLCLTKDMKAGESGEANIEAKHFNFQQIAMFVPESTELFGEVNLVSSARWGHDEKPDVSITIGIPKGKVVQTIEQPVTLGWENIEINASLKNDNLQGNWSVDLTDNGDIQGKLSIEDVLVNQQDLNVTLALNKINLDLLQPLVGEYGKVEALINSTIELSGPVKHPKVIGQLVVDDIVALGDISPIQIEQGKLNVQFDGYHAGLNAAINTNDGVLDVTGDADWNDLTAWFSNIKVHADELKVEVPPMVRIKVKPDMEISLTPKLAKIDGDIYLPWGRITVEELPPSAISVSSDEVILNQNLKPKEQATELPMAIETNINIHVGDEFKLSAFGLTGNLNGKLNVAQQDKGPFVVGEILIKDGQYRSFGQDLIIKEGKILMNGPIDQPYLAITAIRNPDNTQDEVKAGIKVTGPVNEPVTTIFSDPAMPQANALSYLLRGQNIDAKSGGNAMTTALIGLSLAKSGRLVGEIGEAFGVSDLQLDTTGSGDESQVTVSGYITPELQVKYGVGIFDSFGEFTVRYRLLKDLYLEAVSGVNSAVDILYQFEFD